MTIAGGMVEPLDEPLDPVRVAPRQRGQLARRHVDPRGQLLAELLRQRGRHPAVELRRRVHAVDHQAAERHRRLAQLVVEVDGLLARVVPRRGDDQERRRRVLEQRAHPVGALHEAVDHPAERAEEHRQVLEQVDAGDPLHQREHHPGAAPQHLPAEPGGPEEHPGRAPAEEPLQPLRRVEEVERVARRRRVEHQQVEAALLVELVELRDRGELLRAGHRVGELLVDPVREHLVARARVGREPLDQRVERPLRVEHHRPQLARHLDPVGAEALRVDQPRLVAELLEPERRREPPRGVDRDHRDLQPALGHPHRERGRRRRLAHAARAGADDDPLPLDQGCDRSHRTDRRSAGMPRSVRALTGAPAPGPRSDPRARRRPRPGIGCAR